MKTIKELLEEYTNKKMPKCTGETGSSASRACFRLGAAASNELVLQLWEALEHCKGTTFLATENGNISCWKPADETLNSIREKLEGTK